MKIKDETAALLALAPDWLELDSDVEGIRFDSELALRQEIAYASHLHVQTLILPTPHNPAYVTDYARCIADILSASGFIHLSVRIPSSDSSEQLPSTSTRTWETWNTIRALCGYDSRLSVTLDVSTPLPNSTILLRWQAEPVKYIFLPSSTYLANAKGYPVLSKGCQAFLKTMFKFKPTIIISGANKGVHQNGGPEAYAS